MQSAKRAEDVFAILDEFRPLEWTDDERATMSKLYVRILQRLGPVATSGAAADENKDNGPVWYEKM